MDLFSTPIDPAHNWLPKEGNVNYHGPIFSERESTNYYDQALLHEVAWAPDQALMIFGKRIIHRQKGGGVVCRKSLFLYLFQNNQNSLGLDPTVVRDKRGRRKSFWRNL